MERGAKPGSRARRPAPDPAGDVLREVALRLLEVRARSRHELTERLLARGFVEDDVLALVERLCETGLVDDLRFACERALVLVRRGQGPRRVEADLRSRGLAPAVVATALDQIFASEEPAERMRALAEQRFGPGCLDEGADPRLRARVQRFLVQRGFEPDEVHALFA